MKGLGASIKEAWMAMSALQKASIVLAVISVAWNVFSSTISKHNQKLEETRQKNIETAKSSSENANSLKDLYNEYNRLNSIQKKTASEEESFKSVVEDLTKSLGDKAEALEGLTVGTEEYAEALSKATQEELQNQAVNATVGRKSAEEALQDEIWGDLKGSEIGVIRNFTHS